MADDFSVKIGADASGYVSGVNEVKAHTESLAQQLKAQFASMSAWIREPLEALAMLRSSMRETAEIAGAAFAVHEIEHFIEKMGELGETAVNTGAALGMTAEQYQTLNEQFELVGGTGDKLVQTFRILSNAAASAQTSIASGDPNRQADAFKALEINVDDFLKLLRGTPEQVQEALQMIQAAFDRWKASGGNTGVEGPFGALLGRNPALIALLNEGLGKTADKVHELGAPTQDTLEKLKEMGSSIHELAVGFENLGAATAAALSGGLGGFASWLAKVLGDLARLSQLSGSGKPTGIPEIDQPSGEPREDWAQPSGGAVQKQVSDWMAAHGYSPEASAAIQGNIQQESSFNPATMTGEHFGLAQWEPSRRGSLGSPPTTDVAAQMALLDEELTKLDPAFKTASGSVAALTQRFEEHFERAGSDVNMAGRVKYANEAYGGTASQQAIAVDVTAPAPAAGGVDIHAYDAASSAQRKVIEAQITELQDRQKTLDAYYAQEIAGAKGAADKVVTIELQKQVALGAIDSEIMEKRKAIAALGGKAPQDDSAQQIKLATEVQRAQRALTDSQIADALRVEQSQLRLDEQREASELKTADATAKVEGQTASQRLAMQMTIVQAHAAAQAQIIAAEEATTKTIDKLWEGVEERKAELTEKTADKIQELYDKEAEAAKAEGDKIAAPFTQSFDEIGSTFESTITGMITHSTTLHESLKKLWQQILGDFVKMIGDMLSQWAASGLMSLGFGAAAGPGAGLGSVLGQGLFGSAGLFSGGGGGGIGSFLSGLPLIGPLFGGGAAGGGGISSTLLSLPEFGFARGGIVPSAAGGWALPSFAAGGIPSILHGGEMVLPKDISQGMQGMIRGGGAGGDAHFHAHFHGPADAPSMQAWFKKNIQSNSSAVRQMFFNSSLTSRNLSTNFR